MSGLSVRSARVNDLCPWEGFAPATISFCEARLCAAVVEPANAFTSLSKTVVGLGLIPLCVRRGRAALWAIVVAALLQGPLGFSLHATGTWWGEALDVTGMFFISATLLSFALGRRFAWSSRQLIARWLGLVLLSIALLGLVPRSGIPLFSVQVVAWAALELGPGGQRNLEARRWLVALLGCFLGGFISWLADKTRLWCDPHNHVLNGHAVWHLATSACLALFFFYEAALTPAPTSPTSR